jgi:hypothetical protein
LVFSERQAYLEASGSCTLCVGTCLCQHLGETRRYREIGEAQEGKGLGVKRSKGMDLGLLMEGRGPGQRMLAGQL